MQLAQSLRNPPYTDPSAEPEQVIAELRKVKHAHSTCTCTVQGRHVCVILLLLCFSFFKHYNYYQCLTHKNYIIIFICVGQCQCSRGPVSFRGS